MRDKLVVLIILLSVISCSEENLPAGIFHYQVERLLTGQAGSKNWSLVVNTNDCADSVKLMFVLVENSADDSLDVSRISGCDGTSTTTFVGRASASKLTDRDLFTDSLIFASGDHWIINEITSQRLLISVNDENMSYQTSE